MAFPNDHAYPQDLPLWRLDGHQLTAGDRIQATPYEQGEDRHREIRTFTPWLASVSTVLETQAQLDRLEEWYETDIQGGSLPFDTQVAGLNGLLTQWWAARFVGPYRFEAYGIGIYTVTAELILLDGPYDADNLPPGYDPGDPPRIAPSLHGRSYRDSEATARMSSVGMSGRTDRDSELWAISTNTMYGRSERDTTLTAVVASDLLLLDGSIGYLLLEGGTDRMILEP